MPDPRSICAEANPVKANEDETFLQAEKSLSGNCNLEKSSTYQTIRVARWHIFK
jgi:hypothetical protein